MATSIFYKDTVHPTYLCGIRHHKCYQSHSAIKELKQQIRKVKRQAQDTGNSINYLADKFSVSSTANYYQHSNTFNNEFKKNHYYINELICNRNFDYISEIVDPFTKVRE
jgi:hypothetical protein